MAIVSKVSVSKGVTVSVGKFESVRIDASIELTAEKGDDEQSLYEAGFTTVDEQINKQIKDLQDVVEPNSVFKEDVHPQQEQQAAPAQSSRRRR